MIILVLQVESDGQLEIQLHSTALMGSLQCIVHFDVNFWTIESSITWVFFPGFAESVQGFSKGTFCLVPKGVISQFIVWSGWKLQFEIETENAIDVVQEIQTAKHFSHNVLWGAENMSIILTESSNSGETWESTRDFISVEDTEVRESEWQLSVWSDGWIEHQTVTWAVHGLHTETLSLYFE